MASEDPWLTCPVPSPQAPVQLFCVPYAGAGASVFRSWCGLLADVAEVCPVQLPGREQRCNEPLLTSIPRIASELAVRMARFADRPFVIFGHSMGGFVAFETVRELRRRRLPLPCLLVVSACHAPGELIHRRRVAHLPEPEFVAEMSALGGSLSEAFAIPELREFVLPILRADVTACDGYQPGGEPPLPLPIAIFHGLEDDHAGRQIMEPWSRQAETCAGIHAVKGNHFFLHTHRRQLLEKLRALCAAAA